MEFGPVIHGVQHKYSLQGSYKSWKSWKLKMQQKSPGKSWKLKILKYLLIIELSSFLIYYHSSMEAAHNGFWLNRKLYDGRLFPLNPIHCCYSSILCYGNDISNYAVDLLILYLEYSPQKVLENGSQKSWKSPGNRASHIFPNPVHIFDAFILIFLKCQNGYSISCKQYF